jgi:hypothetical protein
MLIQHLVSSNKFYNPNSAPKAIIETDDQYLDRLEAEDLIFLEKYELAKQLVTNDKLKISKETFGEIVTKIHENSNLSNTYRLQVQEMLYRFLDKGVNPVDLNCFQYRILIKISHKI